jgi:hypothetical protein
MLTACLQLRNQSLNELEIFGSKRQKRIRHIKIRSVLLNRASSPGNSCLPFRIHVHTPGFREFLCRHMAVHSHPCVQLPTIKACRRATRKPQVVALTGFVPTMLLV